MGIWRKIVTDYIPMCLVNESHDELFFNIQVPHRILIDGSSLPGYGNLVMLALQIFFEDHEGEWTTCVS